MKHPPAAGHVMNAFPWQHEDVGVIGTPLQSSLAEQQEVPPMKVYG